MGHIQTFTAAQVVVWIHMTGSLHTADTFLSGHIRLAEALPRLEVARAVEAPHGITSARLTPRHRDHMRNKKSITSLDIVCICKGHEIRKLTKSNRSGFATPTNPKKLA